MITIPLKVGHYPPASETPFKWRFAGRWIMAQTLTAGFIALWFFRGYGPVSFLRNHCDYPVNEGPWGSGPVSFQRNICDYPVGEGS